MLTMRGTRSQEALLRHITAIKKTRYVVTHVSDRSKLRVMTFACQGRNTHETAEAARDNMELFNGPNGLWRVLSVAERQTLGVVAVGCYDGHHDPARAVGFDEDEVIYRVKQ